MNIAGETKLKISFFITEYKYKIMVLHTVGGGGFTYVNIIF